MMQKREKGRKGRCRREREDVRDDAEEREREILRDQKKEMEENDAKILFLGRYGQRLKRLWKRERSARFTEEGLRRT
ncbi:hypothetical protein K1719_007109 [Acacia pycnantha]|nr:hypothetical protein K1719_007109 [Acacia pycnantha]